MNPVLVLLGLLVLSYLGSFLVGGRAIQGFGLPSGIEYVALGFVLGPEVLGVIDRPLLSAFEPIAHVALGWIAFIIGLDYGFRRSRPIPAARLAGGMATALFAGGAIAAVLWLSRQQRFTGPLRIVFVVGMAAIGAETTRHASRWLKERHRARGPLTDLLSDVTSGDDLVPILATGLAFAWLPAARLPFQMPLWGWALVTVGIGVVLGIVAAVLLGKEFRIAETWGVLIGTSVLAIGTAARLQLSTLLVAFAMGATFSRVSRHRSEVWSMVRPTEKPVLLPALLLAGAHVELSGTAGPWPLLVALTLLSRFVAKLLSGIALVRASSASTAAGPLLGLGLVSSGALSLAVGLAFALRFPGALGDTVLASAAVVTLVGEFVGPTALRGALVRAGEIDPSAAPSSELREVSQP